MPNAPAFLISIDTEGDNIWARPRLPTTRNAAWLPRFHDLCCRYGFKPTYLTNYEMANCPVMIEFGREMLSNQTGEIGMHLHAWDTPPLLPLTADDMNTHPPLIAYPREAIRAKVTTMTRLLEDRFEVPMRSHRAGRWGFDGFYAQVLAEMGYVVDCSVTPHIVWRYGRLDGRQERIVDYRRACETIYQPDRSNVSYPGNIRLVELPMTVMRCDPKVLRSLRDMLPPASIPARALAKIVTPYYWLRPRLGNLARMTWLLDEVIRLRRNYAQLILHSSELMPGGSPYFPDEGAIEALYEELEALFEHASHHFRGSTIGDFAENLPF